MLYLLNNNKQTKKTEMKSALTQIKQNSQRYTRCAFPQKYALDGHSQCTLACGPAKRGIYFPDYNLGKDRLSSGHIAFDLLLCARHGSSPNGRFFSLIHKHYHTNRLFSQIVFQLVKTLWKSVPKLLRLAQTSRAKRSKRPLVMIRFNFIKYF